MTTTTAAAGARAIQEGKPSDQLWDPHLCMNVLNRLALRMNGDEEALDLLFSISDHLKALALAQNQLGRASAAQFEEWLVALVNLHRPLFGTAGAAPCTVRLEGGLQDMPMQPFAAAFVMAIRRCANVDATALTVHPATDGCLGRAVLRIESSDGATARLAGLVIHAGAMPATWREVQPGVFEAELLLAPPAI